jgi:putative redox protein
MIQARVTLTHPERQGRQFVAETGSGHHVVVDDANGATGAKPIELVAVALAGCTGFDVINILRKKRQHVTGYDVFVEADQSAQPPAVFTRIRIRHVVTGRDIEAAAVEQAIRLSEEKYCAVGNMLNKNAAVATTYEILEEKVNVAEYAAESELAPV